MDRILGVLEIDQLARAGGTVFAACGGESLGDAVVAEGAFVDGLALGVEVAATVGTGLDAVAATEAVILVNEDDAIGADEGGADGADLDAGGIDAVVAELGNEEALDAGVGRRGEAIDGAVGESTCGLGLPSVTS